MTRAYVAVGSNIAPERNVPAALELLARRVHIVCVSTFYRTPALGRPDQPDYVDGVVALDTTLSPAALKQEVLRVVEGGLGRRRSIDRFAPRTIDLDLLLWGGIVVDEGDLQLPARDIEQRAFVAVPLAEIAPGLVLPGSGARIEDVAARLSRGRPAMTPLTGLSGELRRLVFHEVRAP